MARRSRLASSRRQSTAPESGGRGAGSSRRAKVSQAQAKVRKQRSKQRMVWGGILIGVAIIALLVLWKPFISFAFEEKGPHVIDITQYENSPELEPEFRHVRIRGAEMYTFEHMVREVSRSEKTGVVYEVYLPLVGPTNPLHKELERRMDEFNSRDEKPDNLYANHPVVTRCRFVVIHNDKGLVDEARKNPVDPGRQLIVPNSQDPNARENTVKGEAIGILMRFDDLSGEVQEAIADQVFLRNVPNLDQVLFLDLNRRPPHKAIGISCLIVPLIMLGLGAWLAMSEPGSGKKKRDVRGKGKGRKGQRAGRAAKRAGRGRGARARRGSQAEEEAYEADGDADDDEGYEEYDED